MCYVSRICSDKELFSWKKELPTGVNWNLVKMEISIRLGIVILYTEDVGHFFKVFPLHSGSDEIPVDVSGLVM